MYNDKTVGEVNFVETIDVFVENITGIKPVQC